MMTIQHPTPYFDDSYAVNSESQGPYGDAITKELIPYVKRISSGRQGWARTVYGGSTGGWEALASQVFYPDDYNGAWVFCPDVVISAPTALRIFIATTTPISSKAFSAACLVRKCACPMACCWLPWNPPTTMSSCWARTAALASNSTSGRLPSVRSASTLSKPIFNKLTGEIDHAVARY